MGYSDPTAGRDLLGNRSLCFIFICAFGVVTLLQQILYGKNYIRSTQQFTRLKGEEVGNWSALVSYPDDGGMKQPARIGRKRYLESSNGPLLYNTTTCRELRQEITDIKMLSMVKTSELFERWRNLQACTWEQNKEETNNFKMSLSRCCNAPSFLFTTQRNTPSGTKLRYEVDTSGILHISPEIFKMLPEDMPYSKSQFKKCAVIGNGGIIKNSKCGKEIDSADFVFRCNIPPISEKYAADVGTKTHLVTINPSIITERFHKLEKWRRPFYDVLVNYKNASVVLPAFYNARNTDVSFRVKYALDDFSGSTARGVYFFHPQYLLGAQRFWAAQGVRAKRLSSGLMLATAALELCQEVHLYGFWAFPMNPAGIFITHHYYDNVKPRPGFHAMPHELFNFLHLHSRGILNVHTGVCSNYSGAPQYTARPVTRSTLRPISSCTFAPKEDAEAIDREKDGDEQNNNEPVKKEKQKKEKPPAVEDVYEVVTVTGDVKEAGTDANVFVTLYGEYGVTPKVLLASKSRVAFEKNKTDVFRIKTHNVGPIKKLRIEHDNTGMGARWYLDRVTLLDMNRPHLRLFFSCNRWLARDVGDGLTVRYLLGSLNPMNIPKQRKLVSEGKDTFERGNEDKFTIENPNLGRLTKITIGHNNKGSSAGWGCDKVAIDDLGNKEMYEFPVNAWFDISEGDGKIQRDFALGATQPMGIEQVFPCRRWLDEDDGDGLVERELYEMVSLRKCKLKKHQWSLWIFTSDMKGAGTDAQIFIQVYGEKGKSDEIKLETKSDGFNQGQCDKFLILMPEIGKIRKLRIWHEKRHPFSGWHLGRVTLMKSLTREKYNFACNRWLDINEDDQEIIRELPATGVHVPEPLPLVKYRIIICTGNITGSGTDASVYMSLVGDLGDTGERFLFMSKTNVNKFEKGNVDEFVTEAVSLGTLRRVRIGHDGRGGGCGWFLDKVLIREEGQPEATSVEFPCNRWLDRSEDDGQIVRELVPSADGQRLFNVSYHIAIKTGSLSGASSDSKVFVKLYGEKGDTNKILLVASDTSHNNYFETGQTDIFTVETVDLGKINRLLIGHTNEGLQAGWFLDSVLIWVPVHGLQYMFPSHRWLCKDEADGKVEVEIYPSEILDIEKLINYEVTVVTGEVFAAGTDAKVFLQIYGEEGKTEVIQLKSRSNNFERGTTEIFKIEALDVGRVYKIRIGHNGAGLAPGWFLDYIEVKRLIMAMVKPEKKEEEKKDKKKKKKKKEEDEDPGELREVVKTFNFPCGRWLARDEEDGELVVELLAEDYEDLEENTYEVYVFTGSMWGAGTDANVYINIYGEMGDTGERKLRKSNHFNKFERGQVDVFTLMAIDLGQLRKLRIRHDNRQASAGWYLDRVEIMDMKEETKYFFPCQRWLAVDEDDGQLARELVPVDEAFMTKESDEGSPAQLGLEQKAMSTTYTMRIKTGDKKNAGTDANVYTVLYGTNDDTGIINLKASKNNRNKFERGMIDEFTIEAVDLGSLKRIRIGHDNAGSAPGWFLDWVEIDAPSLGQCLCFPCGRWLDKKEDDGAIFRDLYQNKLQTRLYTPYVPYEIKIFTSDIFAAGTDADVFIVLYGQNGTCTSQKSLCLNKRERNMYFERGAEDMFIVELEDIGDIIEKIRIGHDNRGMNGGWHLDRVEIRRLLRKGK
ncbi:lipoxygenase homology domain-containing protein 1, partial [Clarias magur]